MVVAEKVRVKKVSQKRTAEAPATVRKGRNQPESNRCDLPRPNPALISSTVQVQPTGNRTTPRYNTELTHVIM